MVVERASATATDLVGSHVRTTVPLDSATNAGRNGSGNGAAAMLPEHGARTRANANQHQGRQPKPEEVIPLDEVDVEDF